MKFEFYVVVLVLVMRIRTVVGRYIPATGTSFYGTVLRFRCVAHPLYCYLYVLCFSFVVRCIDYFC